MQIYLDHNATSPVQVDHLNRLLAEFQQQGTLGNASSLHAAGRNASVALFRCRRALAEALHCDVSELVFTSGGTENNNSVVKGVFEPLGQDLSAFHAVIGATEHPSVYAPLFWYAEHRGLQITEVIPTASGEILVADVFAKIRPNTVFVSLMAANNETGHVYPVRLLGELLHELRWSKGAHCDSFLTQWGISRQVLQKLHLHVDAVQSFGKIPPKYWLSAGFDSVGVCAHKIGGLAGIGAFLLRRGRVLQPVIMGGSQEKKRRAGTENLLAIISFDLVLRQLFDSVWWSDWDCLRNGMQTMFEEIALAGNGVAQTNSPPPAWFRAQKEDLVGLDFVGDLGDFAVNKLSEQGELRPQALPNTIHFSLLEEQLSTKRKVLAEDLIMRLDLEGVCVSSGSACSSGLNLPSRVLLALGKSAFQAKNSIRISAAPQQNIAELRRATQIIQGCLSAAFCQTR